MIKRSEGEAPWWMWPEQECLFCVSDYAMLAEIYCADCDRPLCPMCVIVIHESAPRFFCPECKPSNDK